VFFDLIFSFPESYFYLLWLGDRLALPENSDVVKKGVRRLSPEDEGLSPVLRLLLAQVVPQSVCKVTMTVPQTAAGKFMFQVARHVLNVATYETASVIDLQRLQMTSQLIGVVRAPRFCSVPFFKSRL
jgi:hypothetical protein